MTEPLSLGAEDAGVSWDAADGAHPVFSGGMPIKGWVKGPGDLWKAPLPDKSARFEQLWVNGRRATLARTPNVGFLHITDSVHPATFPGLEENPNFQAFAVAPEHFQILKDIPKAERDQALITVTHAWAVAQCRIEALDEAALAVKIKGRAVYPFVEFEPDQRYWMENFRSALDAPGEWYLDRQAGEILYHPLPGEDPTQCEILIPVAQKLLTIEKSQDITIRGISFQFANYLYPELGLQDRQAATETDGTLEIKDSSGIRFENCEVAHTGRHAIYFKNGCARSQVVHCHLHDLGAGGVRIGETDRPPENRVCRQIEIDDCIIQHGGRLHPSACGICLTHTQQCRIRHCDIGDLYYTGVSAGWNWGYGESLSRETLLEKCHIHHLGWAYLSDMGGFYGLGTSPGTVIRGNHIHHIASHRYGGWGLYNDEGSTDTLMENNLVHDTANAGFHQHYGYANTVKNNIFAFGRSAQIQRSRSETRLSFKFEGNIVVWDPSSPLFDGGEWNWKLNDPPGRGEPAETTIFRKNLYWPTDGKIPALLTKSKYTWEEWRAIGRDKGSLFADPQFEDLAKRDFRLRPGSPASKIGFVSWDLAEAGVRAADKPWREMAARGHEYPTWEREAQPWPAPPYKVELLTFEHTPDGAIGIRNSKSEIPKEEPLRGQGFAAADGPSSPIPLPGGQGGKRSLKCQDLPGLIHSYEPTLDISPNWTKGRFAVGFDFMGEPGANWFFEMRVKGGEFAAGPYIRWQDGKLVANNTASLPLADIKPGEWCRVEITATTGAGNYQVTLTREDGTKTEFKDIPCKPSWDTANYALFAALGTTKTAFYLDNFSLRPLP
jgi:hypothetical protein